MTRLRLFGLIGGLLFVFVGVLSASASGALPINLPEKARTWTGSQTGKSTFETLKLSTITCEKTGEGTGGTEPTVGKPLGSFHIMFEECKGEISGVKEKCNSLGDAAEMILVSGEWHLVFDELTPELKTAMLFLIKNLHIQCGALVLILISGELLCLHVNPTTKSTKHEFTCKETQGVPEDTRYWNNSGTEVKTSFLSSTNGGTAEGSGEKATGVITTTEEIFADQ